MKKDPYRISLFAYEVFRVGARLGGALAMVLVIYILLLCYYSSVYAGPTVVHPSHRLMVAHHTCFLTEGLALTEEVKKWCNTNGAVEYVYAGNVSYNK